MFTRRIALMLVAFAGACTDPSGPSTISAEFELTDVDGLALPATAPPSVGLPGPTIISGTVSLDPLGGAMITEDRIDSSGMLYIVANAYTYSIQNSNIEFLNVTVCPDGTICQAPPSGQIVDNTLRLRLLYPPGSIFRVYTYNHIRRGN